MARYFIWLPENVTHVERHVPTRLAEEVMTAPGFDDTIKPAGPYAFKGIGEVGGKWYIVFFSVATYETPPKVYINTCFRLSDGQRGRYDSISRRT